MIRFLTLYLPWQSPVLSLAESSESLYCLTSFSSTVD